MTNPDSQKLEVFVHRALREMPEHRAPESLELRVLAAIAEREHVRNGLRSSSTASRIIALLAGLASAVLIAWLLNRGFSLVSDFLSPSGAGQSPALGTAGTVFRSLLDAGGACLRAFQPYLIALAILIGGAYAALIGFGASLYRNFATNN